MGPQLPLASGARALDASGDPKEASTDMPALSRRVLSDAVYTEIKDRIIRLQLAPGESLSIDGLREELGVSSTPIREALNRLSAANLVRFEPFKGFTVEPLLSYTELRQLHEVRALIEIHAIRTGGERLRDEQADVLDREIDAMERLLESGPFDVAAFNMADEEFHIQIVTVAGNPVLERAYRSLNVHVQIARLFNRRGKDLGRAANAEHKEIAAALRAGAIERAATHAARHIDAVADRLRSISGAAFNEDAAWSGERRGGS
jgi:DNA-binding GntR family transcriptional regulator